MLAMAFLILASMVWRILDQNILEFSSLELDANQNDGKWNHQKKRLAENSLGFLSFLFMDRSESKFSNNDEKREC